MRIAVLANLKQNAPHWDGMPDDQWDDLDSPKTVNAIVAALQSAGHEAAFFEASLLPPHNLVEKLTTYRPDMCFNIAEGHFGDSRESQVPGILEMLRIPYTGSKPLALALALDKPMTKRVLLYHGLPTPEFQVFEQADEPISDDLLNPDGTLRFPLFVKPSREGTSMGISAQSIVHTVDELRRVLARHLALYRQPILVEHFIEGREMMVGIIGNLHPTKARRIREHTVFEDYPEGLTFLPVLEVLMDQYGAEEAGVYSSNLKVNVTSDPAQFYHNCPAQLTPPLERELKLLAASVFCVTGCLDVARIDFRLDSANDDKPYILEINPLPGLNPASSDLCHQARGAGWSYEALINRIFDAAVERQQQMALAALPGPDAYAD